MIISSHQWTSKSESTEIIVNWSFDVWMTTSTSGEQLVNVKKSEDHLCEPANRSDWTVINQPDHMLNTDNSDI